MTNPPTKDESPSFPFSFGDHVYSGTFQQMSDDHFAMLVAFSTWRNPQYDESYRSQFSFKDGMDITAFMIPFGIKEESVEHVLRDFGRVGWLDVTIGEQNSEIPPDDRDDDAPSPYDLNAKHDGNLIITVRSYVLDALEGFYPEDGRFYIDRKRPDDCDCDSDDCDSDDRVSND